MPESLRLYASVGPQSTHYDLDDDNASLTRYGTVDLSANVHYAWPHVQCTHLYVASSDSASCVGGIVADRHHVSALRLDQSIGALSPHGAPIALPTRLIHLTTDIPSRHVLVAFSNPSGIRVYRINSEATLGAEVAQSAAIDPGIYAHQVRVGRLQGIWI
jgi:6-phosphogluconolactonase (cycloisomerase 2 family)